MKSGRSLSAAATMVLCVQLLPAAPAFPISADFVEQHYDAPIDAFSVGVDAPSVMEYSYLQDDVWSEWQPLATEFDEQPETHESSLAMLPYGVTALRVSGIGSVDDIHPITVGKEPVSYEVAAINTPGKPFILRRNEWGADESYLYKHDESEPAASSGDKGDNGGTSASSGRITDCERAQVDYPAEFRVKSTVTKDSSGRTYRWPLQYSPSVKLLAVHHSALLVRDDPRPAAERVRALYKYHTQNRGWGDIGYHYVIDEEGQVYEGRQGGKNVVGGHAYCNNVGTVGVVMLGNFEIEQPTQKQTASLQHLLTDLARDYGIDLQKQVQFHGKTFASPVVRHKDLVSTLCPGYYVSDAFGQIVKNIRDGKPDAAVRYAVISKPSPVQPSPPSSSSQGLAPGVSFTGRSTLTINPGGKQRLSFAYTADAAGAYEGKKVADVRLSDPDIKLFVDNGRAWIPVTTGILLSSDVPAGETVTLQLIVQAPMQAGNYVMDIAGMRFKITVAGRRARTGNYVNPFTGDESLIVQTPRSAARSLSSRIRPYTRRSMQGAPSSQSASSAASVPALPTVPPSPSNSIRIRLSASAQPSIVFTEKGKRNGTMVQAGTTLDLIARGSECAALSRGVTTETGPVLRFSSDAGILTVNGIKNQTRSYRGTLECRIVDGALALINELPLEDYMLGLAEEPDTEPYEKQRAFAIAARTYALFYTDPANRKFSGKPYDGSDDPAVFQVYVGVSFEEANPRWLRAVGSTSGDVLTFEGKVIKPPYFSSDDGRTRSPEEAGWKNFPFASIFASKSDPWCTGMALRGHGVGMSGCGAEAQAHEGKSAEQILQYYYPGTRVTTH